jgi:LmbE family N-acetylglucosaminyl deacetylase
VSVVGELVLMARSKGELAVEDGDYHYDHLALHLRAMYALGDAEQEEALLEWPGRAKHTEGEGAGVVLGKSKTQTL